MKFDLHTHHERCGHADGTIEDYIQSAIEQQFEVIGISDHSPFFAHIEEHAYPHVAMAKKEFAAYVNEVLQLKQKYEDQITVLLGVESDFFPISASIYKEQYKKYPFDYIIGSIHSVNGISIFNKNRWKKLSEQEQIEVKEHYYDLISYSAKSGMFDILGHIDAMKGFYPTFSDLPTSRVEDTLKTIGDCEVAIEVNTSGKTKDVGGWYPSHDILEKALFYNVEVSFGSDAHIPSRVGDDFELVREKLKQIGFKHWVYFNQRQKVKVSL
ncbi:histidinol-phosphatase [Longirhabdus pacifica]|uniref:histidinol-phosphatase n=1 Tax=Longirhabdus pacifica TaxID=2305227 RepID=UPI00100901EC|nr:histidinol-phosphatase [Longirhabdus pacifica]